VAAPPTYTFNPFSLTAGSSDTGSAFFQGLIQGISLYAESLGHTIPSSHWEHTGTFRTGSGATREYKLVFGEVTPPELNSSQPIPSAPQPERLPQASKEMVRQAIRDMYRGFEEAGFKEKPPNVKEAWSEVEPVLNRQGRTTSKRFAETIAGEPEFDRYQLLVGETLLAFQRRKASENT
jgi:hypothetical protein